MNLLAAMRIYVRVVERGSMSAAARDLGIGQPAISERVERLERHLGIKLLHRSPRALKCTEEGIDFYSNCKAVLAAAEEACAIAKNSSKTIDGTIRIASPQCFGEVVLPHAISEIHKHHPHLRFDLVLNDRIVDPVTEGVDISFRLGTVNGENVIANRLGYVRRSLVASPKYIAAHGVIEEPDDLALHPFIHVKGLFQNATLPLEDALGNTVQAEINPAIVATHWRPMHELILSGIGIGVVQTPGCASDLLAGRLVRLLPQYEVPKFELAALMPAGQPVTPKVKAVIAIIRKYLPEVSGFIPD